MDIYESLRRVQQEAYDRAPAIRALYDTTGMKPADLRSAEELTQLPVTKKETLLDHQRENPPFGGYLAADPTQIARIFVAPGPIYEPQLIGETGGHGFKEAFSAAGFGPGDVVLNTWSYHMVPAGLLLDKGLRSVGATVIPSGVGASEQQMQLILEMGVTSICASTAFFITLAEGIERSGAKLPRDWKVKSAFLGGELGDWMGKRRRLEERYGISTFSAYATADIGVIGYETRGDAGYAIHPERLVQICDPVTGQPVAAGEPGEIVVTTLTRGWPLIRFGTGDVAFATAMRDDGTVARIGPLQGRVGQAVKAREIFVYPRQIEELIIRVPGIQHAQAVVTQADSRDEIVLRLVLEDGADAKAVLAAVPDQFRELSRLRADRVDIVANNEINENAALLLDERR